MADLSFLPDQPKPDLSFLPDAPSDLPDGAEVLPGSAKGGVLDSFKPQESPSISGSVRPQDSYEFRQAPPQTPLQIGMEKFKRATGIRASEEERIATSMNSYAISKKTGIPQPDIDKNIRHLQRNSKLTGIKSQLTEGEYLGLAVAPLIVKAAITAPVSIPIGLAAFAALDKIIPTEKFIPSDASDTFRTTVELVDFVGKGWLLHGMSKKSPAFIQKYAQTKIEQYKLPKFVKISGDKIASIFREGVGRKPKSITPPEMELVKDLGLDAKGYKNAINKGLDIEVPAAKLSGYVDKPWFAKFKKLFRINRAAEKFPGDPLLQAMTQGGELTSTLAGEVTGRVSPKGLVGYEPSVINLPPPPAQGPTPGGVQFGGAPVGPASPLVEGAPGTPPTDVVQLGGTNVLSDIFGNVAVSDATKPQVKPSDEEAKKMLGQRVKDSLKGGVQGPSPIQEGMGAIPDPSNTAIQMPDGTPVAIKDLPTPMLEQVLSQALQQGMPKQLVDIIKQELTRRGPGESGQGALPEAQPPGPDTPLSPNEQQIIKNATDQQLKDVLRDKNQRSAIVDATIKELERRKSLGDKKVSSMMKADLPPKKVMADFAKEAEKGGMPLDKFIDKLIEYGKNQQEKSPPFLSEMFDNSIRQLQNWKKEIKLKEFKKKPKKVDKRQEYDEDEITGMVADAGTTEMDLRKMTPKELKKLLDIAEAEGVKHMSDLAKAEIARRGMEEKNLGALPDDMMKQLEDFMGRDIEIEDVIEQLKRIVKLPNSVQRKKFTKDLFNIAMDGDIMEPGDQKFLEQAIKELPDGTVSQIAQRFRELKRDDRGPSGIKLPPDEPPAPPTGEDLPFDPEDPFDPKMLAARAKKEGLSVPDLIDKDIADIKKIMGSFSPEGNKSAQAAIDKMEKYKAKVLASGKPTSLEEGIAKGSEKIKTPTVEPLDSQTRMFVGQKAKDFGKSVPDTIDQDIATIKKNISTMSPENKVKAEKLIKQLEAYKDEIIGTQANYDDLDNRERGILKGLKGLVEKQGRLLAPAKIEANKIKIRDMLKKAKEVIRNNPGLSNTLPKELDDAMKAAKKIVGEKKTAPPSKTTPPEKKSALEKGIESIRKDLLNKSDEELVELIENGQNFFKTHPDARPQTIANVLREARNILKSRGLNEDGTPIAKTPLEQGIEEGSKKKAVPVDETTDVTIQANSALDRIKKLPESFLKLNPNYFKKDIAMLKDILKNPKQQRLATIREIEKRITAVDEASDKKLVNELVDEGSFPPDKKKPLTPEQQKIVDGEKKTPLEEGIGEKKPAFDMTKLTQPEGDSPTNQPPGKPLKDKFGVFLKNGTGRPTAVRVTKKDAQDVADKLNAKGKGEYLVEQVRSNYVRPTIEKKKAAKKKAAEKEQKKPKKETKKKKIEREKGVEKSLSEMRGVPISGKYKITPTIHAELTHYVRLNELLKTIKRPVDPITKEVMDTKEFRTVRGQESEALKDLISTIEVQFDVDRKQAVGMVNTMLKKYRAIRNPLKGEGGFIRIGGGLGKRARALRIRALRTKREVAFAKSLQKKIKKVMASATKAKLSIEDYIRKNPKAFPEAPKNLESLQASLRQVVKNVPISIKEIKKGDIVMFRDSTAMGIVEGTGDNIQVRWKDGLGEYTQVEAIRDLRQTGDALRLRKLPRKKLSRGMNKILANNPKHIQLAEIANASIDAAIKNPDDQLVQATATAVTQRLIRAIIGKTIDINDIPAIVMHYDMTAPGFIKTLVQDLKTLSSEAGQVLNLLSQNSKQLKKILLEAGATPDEINDLFPSQPRHDMVSRTIHTIWGKINRAEQFRKGFLTSQIKTAMRNAEVQGVMTFGEYVEDVIIAGYQKITGTGIKGKEMAGVKAYKNAVKSSMLDILRFAKNLRKLNMKPKVRRRIYKLLDQFPVEKANLLRAPIQDVFIRSKVIETLNAVNILQEHFFRTMIVQQELTKFAARHNTHLGNVPFFKNNMLRVIESIENGLLKTFSSNLKDVPVLGDTVEFFVRNPIIAGIAGNPFIRFYANNMYTIFGRKSPVQLLNLMSPKFRKALNSPNNEKNLKILSRGFLGMVAFVAAMTLRHEKFAGPKFYQIKLPWKNKKGEQALFDTRPFAPLPQYMFLVEFAKNMMGNTKETRLTATDFFQGIFAVSRIAGTGLAIIDLIRSEPFTEKVDEQASKETRSRIIKNFFGQYMSAPSVPFKQFQDIVGIFDPAENVYKSVQESPLMGPTLNNLPWAKRLLPDLQEFGRGESRTKGRIGGGVEFFTGLRAQALNPLEIESARLGLSSQHPRSGNPAINQLVVDEMNEGMHHYGNLLVTSPEYKSMDDEGRRLFIKSYLEKAFSVGREAVKLYSKKGQDFYGRKDAAKIRADVQKEIGSELLDIYIDIAGEDPDTVFSQTEREFFQPKK